MLKVTSRFCLPNRAPLFTPSSRMCRVTLVPAAQYCCGRKSTRSVPNQCQEPVTGGSEVTVSCFSTAVRSGIGLSKVMETGCATP